MLLHPLPELFCPFYPPLRSPLLLHSLSFSAMGEPPSSDPPGPSSRCSRSTSPSLGWLSAITPEFHFPSLNDTPTRTGSIPMDSFDPISAVPVTITVRTPTLCKPDTSDRPCYFSFNLLNLATPLLSYAVRLVLLIFVLFSSLPCYLYDAVLIPTLGYLLFTNWYIP
jgi:hypothetical protein